MADYPELVIRSYEDLIAALRAVKSHLQLSNETLEQISGITAGGVDKYLGPTRSKHVGAVAFDLLLGGLAIELHVRPNLQQAEKMADRWERRNGSAVRMPARVSKTLIDRALRHLASEFSPAEILTAIDQARSTVAAEANADHTAVPAAQADRPAPVPAAAAYDGPVPDEFEALADNASITVGAGRDRRGSKLGGLRFGGQQTARTRLRATQAAYLARAKAVAATQV